MKDDYISNTYKKKEGRCDGTVSRRREGAPSSTSQSC